MKSSKRIISSPKVKYRRGGGRNYNFPGRLNITVLFAAALFLAAAFFVTYSEPNESDADGGSAGNLTWDFTDGVLMVSCTGDMENYTTAGDRPWNGNILDIQSVVIKQGMTSIGDGAFAGCTSLASVTIPNSVKTIGLQAFAGCTSLESIVIPDSVEEIGDGTFWQCASLASIVIPDSVEEIGDGAFAICTSLETATVTGGLVNGEIAEGGIIYTFFKKGAANNWAFLNSADLTTPFSSLTLRDIRSIEYGPGNIEGGAGRELHYSDAEYVWNGTEWNLVSCSVFGTLTVTGGSASTGDAEIFIEYLGTKYSADIGDDGIYAIRGLPSGAYGGIKAILEGYTQTQVSVSQPLTKSVTGMDITLTAVPSSPAQYSVTFSSGSYYTVYDAKGPVSSPISVAGGGSLSFTVKTSEGYSASPSVISGNAEIIHQTDGWYRISDIRSDVRVTVTVSAAADNSPYDGSGNGLGGGDSGNDGISYWVPVLAVGAFLACIAAAAIGHTVLMRRKS
jgi:hypothetical protein